MTGFLTGFVGTAVEAWHELRTHRVRVLMSLIGVAVAVTAITGVTALVEMMSQAFKEQAERQSGRSVTLTLNAWSTTGALVDPAVVEDAFARTVERHRIEYASRDMWSTIGVRLPSGTRQVSMRAVDPDLGVINRIVPVEGRWLTDADAALMAPTLVVNEAFLRELGDPPLASHPTVVLQGRTPVTAVIVGVLADQWPGEEPSGFLPYDQLARWELVRPDVQLGQTPSLVLWVPPDMSREVQDSVVGELTGALPGMQLDAWDNQQDWTVLDGGAQWVALGVGAFALLLGGLGLVNIAMVTVRYRIREIGIRRALGATSWRIFVGVLMESVVATAVAGVVGVILAVVLIRSVPIEIVFGMPLQDVPPFPVSAAVTGLLSATGVGALAGLLPAATAVRVKVIDAIRY